MTDLIPVLDDLAIAPNFNGVSSKSETAESFFAFFNDKAKLTAKTYAGATREFIAFIAENHGVRDFTGITRNHVIFYKRYLTDKGLANNTILKKISAISSLCRFVGLEKDVTFGITRPKSQNKRDTAGLTDEEVRKILGSLDPKAHAYPLHYAILVMGFYTGLRSKEIRQLTIADIGDIDGHRVLRTKIKGDKVHMVPLNPIVVRALNQLIERKAEMGHEVGPTGYLFASFKHYKNSPLSATPMAYIFDTALAKAAIQKSTLLRYSPHSMRATVAGNLLDTAGVPLEDVQKLLGHASPTTTQRYNKRKKSLDTSPVYKIAY